MKSEKLLEIGGREWVKGDIKRIYFNDLEKWYGLECGYYNTGSISSATVDGESVSNSQARRIIYRLESAKIWYDPEDNKFHGKNIDDDDFHTIVSAIKIAYRKLETVNA